MEWDFTTSQLYNGEVNYGLEDFLRDFQIEVDTNFSNYDKQQRESLCGLFYSVMYFNFTGHSNDEISKTFGIDPEFVKIILKSNQANLEMLGAVIMTIFLRNLRETDGLLSDEENLQLVNAELRQFHYLHKL